MNAGLIIDIIFGCILAFFVIRGIFRGFSGEIIGLVGLLVSVFCAWNFTDRATEMFLKYLPSFDKTLAALVCAIVIFFAVEIIFAIIGFVLSFAVSAAKLSFLDHLLGIVTGALKTACIILFVYALCVTFPTILPTDWMKDSYTMKYSEQVWPAIRDFLESHGLMNLSALAGK